MVLSDEVARRLVTAAAVVDVHVIRTSKVDIRRHEHGGDSGDRVREGVVLREPQPRDRDDEALDPALEHQV